ncbi:MAG: wax ester/triacylglycerol synthase family O-acyltransferase [Pseudomonadota bacterium]
MQQLSGLDATFLHLESHRSPMHIGSVYLLDAEHAPGFSHQAIMDHIAARLPLVPLFRQRLIEAPLELTDPYWVNDPDFDLAAHVPRVGCPAPGGKQELMELAGRIFARPLNRMRPLWEITLVDGVDRFPGLSRGSFAVITRMHHAAVDGVSGAEIMGALLDVDPAGRGAPLKDNWKPEAIPSSTSLLRKSYAQLGHRSVAFARFVGDLAKGGVKMAVATRTGRIDPPTLPMRAPRTRFNRVVSTERVFGSVEFTLDAIKGLRSRVAGSTVNDVLLSICAGALRRQLDRSGELPEQSLVAMAPISVRATDAQQAMGNQVSAMLVEIATDLDDPRARLERIHRNTRSSKVHGTALPANQIMEFVPSATAAIAARLYTRMRVAEKHKPFFNLVITNVPGPPMPLYFAGARLRSVFGTAPLMDGLGLILVIFSHAGRISVGITGCKRALPDVASFEADLEAAFEELAGAPTELPVATRPRPREPRVEPPETGRPLEDLRAAIRALGDSVDAARDRSRGDS